MPKSQIQGVIADRAMLVGTMTDYGFDISELADTLHVSREDVASWMKAYNAPDDVQTGKLLALMKERYKVCLSDELFEVSKQHRRAYMRDYYRALRAAPASKAKLRQAENERRRRNRLDRNEKERARYARLTPEQRKARGVSRTHGSRQYEAAQHAARMAELVDNPLALRAFKRRRRLAQRRWRRRLAEEEMMGRLAQMEDMLDD